MKRKTIVLLSGIVAIAVVLFFFWPTRTRHDQALQTALAGILNDYRKIIVLMDGADRLDETTHARCVTTGQVLFWRKQRSLRDLAANLSDGAGFQARVEQLIRYLSADPSLHDADKLAFLDLVDELADGKSASAPKLRSLLDNLQSIQLAYRQEVTRIFSQFATRGASGGREKWDSYVADIRKNLTREQVLAEFAAVVPEEPTESMRGGKSKEIFGTEFPAKTVALTFDDGPHTKYTEQVLAVLSKYGLKACFFQVGYPLGAVDATGAVKLYKAAEISRKVVEAGHLLANHSYSHPVLAKLPESERNSEIDRTSLILEKISGLKTELFRAPYGARNAAIIDRVTSEGLRSIMWNINAEDWADPIPESIAMRILHQMNQQHKGIIVLHDIHKQSVLAISPVVEELLRQEYSFLAFDHGQFAKFDRPSVTDRSSGLGQAPTAPPPPDGTRKLYRDSWAVIIGINDYQKWPKLRYAVNDANGMEDVLVTRFGFQRDHIRKLIDAEATRQRIMEVLGDELSDSRKVQREDRVFFFFAGHGATRTLEDGRQIGFIVPADADRSNYYSTAISMTALREAADLIPAKHVYFVMDSCYSGLAMSRGSGAFSRDRSYLEEVTRRTARQILTAGGAEQEVADDGPNGHSVFTWALLQGLDGQADLDGNGVITASELGAYISPIVSSFARQTPAVGNLVGSEGGEFIFELQPQPLSAPSGKVDSRSLQLNEQLSSLQKQIAAKQEELLKLQQSIQSQSQKLAQVTRSPGRPSSAAPASSTARAYDLERQGMLFYREKKYDDALQKFQGAVELKPGDAVLLNNLGYLYHVMGRYDDALTYLQKTLAIDPRRKEAHQNIADTYLKLNRRAEAKQHYEQFLALQPGSSRSEEVRRILESLN
jgi:peptidoglycan/xylan/chitin deacetylase (PgdA/CDA1 family)/tetratricopeptide (TPR) repeat protein